VQNSGYQPIERQKTANIIIHKIWNMILSGELKPGDRLPPERELMTIFNVSKASLREALQTLESYGHIKKKRGVDGGSVILPLLPDNGISLILNYLKQQKYTKEDLIEARLLIEPLIVELAARKIDEKGRQRLREAMAAHEKDYQVKGTSRLGWESNLVYSELTGNPILTVIEELLIRILLDLEFSLGMDDIECPERFKAYNHQSYTGHKRIIQELIDGNPEKSKAAAFEHKKRWGELLMDIAEEEKPE